MREALYSLLAVLLEYPTPGLEVQVRTCLESQSIEQPGVVEKLVEFQDCLQTRGGAWLEEIYTSTFDMQPVCYPYVGYQLFGESYKRGAFMAKLVEGYRAFGFDAGRELPDHIAVILRFLGTSRAARKSDFGHTLLLEGLLPSLEKMVKALEGQEINSYGVVLSAALIFLEDVTEREMVHA